jgi:hypothetical protein
LGVCPVRCGEPGIGGYRRRLFGFRCLAVKKSRSRFVRSPSQHCLGFSGCLTSGPADSEVSEVPIDGIVEHKAGEFCSHTGSRAFLLARGPSGRFPSVLLPASPAFRESDGIADRSQQSRSGRFFLSLLDFALLLLRKSLMVAMWAHR